MPPPTPMLRVPTTTAATVNIAPIFMTISARLALHQAVPRPDAATDAPVRGQLEGKGEEMVIPAIGDAPDSMNWNLPSFEATFLLHSDGSRCNRGGGLGWRRHGERPHCRRSRVT